MLLAYFMTTVMLSSPAIATEEMLEESIQRLFLGSCEVARVEKNAQKIGLKSGTYRAVFVEDRCTSEEFCFTAKLHQETEVESFLVPQKGEIRYCEKSGLRAIDSFDMGTSNGDLRCRSTTTFLGNSKEICSCYLEAPYTIKMGGSNNNSVVLPKGLLYRTLKGQISVLSVKYPPHSVGEIKLLKDTVYNVQDGEFVASKETRESFDLCGVRRLPESGDMELIKKNYGLTEKDFADARVDTHCSGGIPYDESSQQRRAVVDRLKTNISTSVLSLPEGASLDMCKGEFEFASKQGKELILHGHSCDGMIGGNERSVKGSPVYKCHLYKEKSFGKYKLPKGAELQFTKEKPICFSGKDKSERPITVDGKVLSGESYYWLDEKGELKEGKHCPMYDQAW